MAENRSENRCTYTCEEDLKQLRKNIKTAEDRLEYIRSGRDNGKNK